jgi:hypothetical protein
MSGRRIKSRVLEILRSGGDLSPLNDVPLPRLINALLSALCRPEEESRWPAVEALGRAVARLAGEDPEAARNHARRLVWNLNDESGTIPWGSAEALAEILARAPDLGREFSAILVFRLRDDPGSPDFLPLVEGALWAVGRLALADKAHAAGAGQHLGRFLSSPEPRIRALAAWTAGLAGEPGLEKELAGLAEDQTPVRLFLEGQFRETTVGRLAQKALANLSRE